MSIHAHPFMANSVDAVVDEMLGAIGAARIDDLFAQIPADHRAREPLQLEAALPAEADLRRDLQNLLARNAHCADYLSFLGGGCWQHHVPAVCDEIVRRSEFLTSVWGTPSSDHGRYQAWFEFCSQLGELVDCDLVGLPVYTWGCAAGHALRMAARLTGRREVLVPEAMDRERRLVVDTYCEPPHMPNHLRVITVRHDRRTGGIDMDDLAAKLGPQTAAVYLETPNAFGVIEQDAPRVAAMAHAAGAQTIAGVDPLSLGVLAPPPAWGADIVVGTTQTLGVHMHGGGGLGGFIATRDEERYAREYPTLLVSLAGQDAHGTYGFGLSLVEQTSYGAREHGKDWTGNSVYLWAIANAVYLSLMGPRGFEELGALLVARANYAARRLAAIPGVSIAFDGPIFKEFVVDFNATGLRVAELNAALRERRIFGGHDLSEDFPEGGQRALYCVTELHRQPDIDRLADTLTELISHAK